MKIRNRITLWITGTGLIAGLFFSVIISYELIEQPFELIDRELERQAYTLLVVLSPQDGHQSSLLNSGVLASLGSLYWFKVFDQHQKIICVSSMARAVDLPLRKEDKRYNIHATVPAELTSLNPDDGNNVTFRVRVATIAFGGKDYLVQIARPMEKLWEEIVELAIAIGVGLLFFTLVLILLGYFVAGKILQPVIDINVLAQEINDNTLDKRIPLGRNQDELYSLSSSLNQMFDRLQFSFKRQKAFIANASHELKTPIALQRIFYDEAVQREDLPEDFMAKLVTQSETTLRMARLVKNLLELSTLELNETLAVTSIDLTEMAVSVLEEFDDIIKAAGIKLTLNMEEPVRLSADKDKLRRVLINLVDNGIKYNLEQKGEICFSLNKTNDEIQLTISNTGQFIPEDELKLLFMQFYRVEKSRSTTLGGSGLGLTIVKQIIELHRGTIEIESTSAGWFFVRVLLPVARS